ncbi:hypothetical protein CAOG_009625 [Capsaspora owczarzaki ATCC 30864]|uniref:Golgin-84 n=2 Tax=Capsaspora owczarzaki (strain ATCC 30864) TaxID=595528 RepID=A0A0D2WNM3_CAPO3|nr:hypothetical protein CAOG_009625 [Capsaspora owczarzaki ATCC 30864]
MLRNEIKSLNEEIALHGRRSKNMQINLDEARKQISVVERQVAAKEQQVREQTLREEQLHGQIKDLERQQQALKAQLLESDKILSLRDNTITDLQKVKQDVLHDQAAVAEVQSSAFESLRARLVEAERLLDAETQLTASLKQAQIKTRAETDEVRLDLERQLTVAHTAAQDQMTQLGQLKQTLAAQRSDNDTIKTEFAEYKNRAAKVLQTKEKVIADMRLLAETSSTLMNSGPGAEAARSELIAAQRERDQLSEELNETRLQVSQLRSQIQELETQHQAETDMLQDHLHEIENAAQEEKTNHTNLLADMRARVEDADFARNEVFKQKTALQAQLLDRAAEIERLHAQLSTRTNNSVNQVDLENRLRTLTENLIRKQTEIETLMSEKNSLHLQLETERNKRAKEVRLQIDHPPAANSLEEDNTKLRPISSIIPAAMEARPNANLTRRVRQAATVLDTFSIRLGRFLRIYPMARVFVIFYMLLLHLWVMIVLFTYSPELHSAGHEGVEPIDPFPR